MTTTLASGGCVGTAFKVEAVRTPRANMSPVSYQLVSLGTPTWANASLTERSLSFARAALSSKGMFEAPAGSTAEMIVEIDFAVEPSRMETRTYTNDITEFVAEKITTVTETKKQPDGSTVTVTREVKEPAHYEKVGEETVEYQVEIFPKFFRISARENSPPGEAHRQLWSVYVTNEDESDDLYTYLPMMVAAAMDFIDRATAQEKTIEISTKDRRLEFVLRGMPPTDDAGSTREGG
jgi:hypothetical protein